MMRIKVAALDVNGKAVTREFSGRFVSFILDHGAIIVNVFSGRDLNNPTHYTAFPAGRWMSVEQVQGPTRETIKQVRYAQIAYNMENSDIAREIASGKGYDSTGTHI
jgi:hypothetical protein